MRDAARVMEAALERIADPTEIAGMGVTEAMTGPAAVELRARMEMAHRALAEVRALPASNTETLAADNMRLVIEKQAAEARLAQIWGEAAAVRQGADELARILFARDGYAHAMSIRSAAARIRRLARGEEASE
jgi:hypothetical protein